MQGRQKIRSRPCRGLGRIDAEFGEERRAFRRHRAAVVV
jgi:hypothetical protein